MCVLHLDYKHNFNLVTFSGVKIVSNSEEHSRASPVISHYTVNDETWMSVLPDVLCVLKSVSCFLMKTSS